MTKLKKVLFKALVATLLSACIALFWHSTASFGTANAMHRGIDALFLPSGDSLAGDTITSHLRAKRKENPFSQLSNRDSTALYLKKPSNIHTEVLYDALTGQYLITEKAGAIEYRLPGSLSLHEFIRSDLKESVDRYWRKKISKQSLERRSQIIPQFQIGGDAFNKVFGSSIVNIRPQGYVEMSLGLKSNKIENPAIPTRMQRNTTFDFNQKINVSQIGRASCRERV